MNPNRSRRRLQAAAALRGGASYRLAAEAAGVTKATVVRWMKDQDFRWTVKSMPEPGAQRYYITLDVGAGWLSILLAPGYRLAADALGQIILRACSRYADDDRFTVSMPNRAVLTLAGIAPQCVASLHTDIRGILDRPRSLRA
jgi:hypothetical protein